MPVRGEEGGRGVRLCVSRCRLPRCRPSALCAIAHQDRTTQYAVASQFKHCCLWNTGSPAPSAQLRTGRATTSSVGVTPHSRDTKCPGFAFGHPRKAEGAGNAGCTTHPLPCVQNKTTHAGQHRYAEITRHSLRNGFTAAPCSPRGTAIGFTHLKNRLRINHLDDPRC